LELNDAIAIILNPSERRVDFVTNDFSFYREDIIEQDYYRVAIGMWYIDQIVELDFEFEFDMNDEDQWLHIWVINKKYNSDFF